MVNKNLVYAQKKTPLKLNGNFVHFNETIFVQNKFFLIVQLYKNHLKLSFFQKEKNYAFKSLQFPLDLFNLNFFGFPKK